MLADPVRNNFTSEREIVNSNDCLSLTNTGHASTPYKSTGKHLARNKLISTSSDANLPTLLKIELNALKYCLCFRR